MRSRWGPCVRRDDERHYSRRVDLFTRMTRQVICPTGCRAIFLSSPGAKNFSFRASPKSVAYPSPSCLPEGRFAIVTDVRRDAVDADALADEERDGGRRSRVVLTPRRWRSSLAGLFLRDDGDKKARSPGRARRKPLKPLRRECRVFSGVTAVTNARVYYTPRAAAGAPAPGIPCAL